MSLLNEIPTLMELPEGAPPKNRMFLWGMPSQSDEPDLYTTPFDDELRDCLPSYETASYIYTSTVDATAMVAITGVSYEFDQDAPVGDMFTVELLRSHDTLCAWDDVVIAATGDRGNRFGMCSHFRPFPVEARFERNDQIQVRVTYHGPYPFTKTSGDVLNYQMRIVLHGRKGAINTTGDGALAKQASRRMPLSEAPRADHGLRHIIRKFADLSRSEG